MAATLPAGVVVFAVLAAAYTGRAAIGIDEAGYGWARSLPPWASQVGAAVGALGGRIVLTTLVGGGFVLLLAARRRADALFLAAAVGGADLLLHLLKLLLDRDRPGEGVALPASAAFPGGHATTALAAYGAVALLALPALGSRAARRAVLAGTAVLTLGVAASQVTLGRRTVVEICAGLIVGAVWLGGCVAARRGLVVARPRRAMALAGGAAAALVLVQALAAAVSTGHGRLPRLDERIAAGVADGAPGWLAAPARVVTHAGGGIGMAALALAAGAVFHRTLPHRRLAAALAPFAAYVGAQLLTLALKAATDRPRPTLRHDVDLPSTAAFPSGHTSAAFGVVVTVALVGSRPRLLAALLAFASLVGASRVVLGVHWTSDVAGGAALGTALGALIAVALDARRRPRSGHPG